LCGNVCNNLPNVATGTCLASSCNVVVCDGGFADCTGASGCETSIVDDASNCGACGRTCGAGGQCGAGICDEILQIANGQYHTCALRSSGTVVCWGENGSGQLGIGTTTDQLTPVVVPGLSDVVDLVAGWEHTCALLANGRVRCWGGNGQDQVGDGSGSDQLSPTPVVEAATMGELDRVTDLGASRYGTCGLRTTGELACWGQNASGMIDPWDLGSATFAFARPATFDSCGDGCTPDRVVRFTMGARYIAAIVAYTGKGTFVELQAQGDAPGDIGSTAGVSYLPFGTLGDVVELASGNDHVCLRRASGTVECIGDNTNGQLADGSTITGSSPVVTLFTSATALMLFDDTTCVRNTLGQVYCMGATNEAECTGPGSAMPVLAPRRVNVAAGGAAYSARYLANGGGGAYRTPCLVSTAGAVHCWGNNIGGQIGNGNTTGQEYPTRVVGLTP
jgi:alpha-tubulin suppressor-like RCC1 family protein